MFICSWFVGVPAAYFHRWLLQDAADQHAVDCPARFAGAACELVHATRHPFFGSVKNAMRASLVFGLCVLPMLNRPLQTTAK
jgi:hypothetical protein